jgi:hypothetical protein
VTSEERRAAVGLLRRELEERAGRAPGVELVERDGLAEFRVGGRTVAVVEATALSFRLGGEIAAAAARTTDAGTSERGPDWVRFSPSAVDRLALDRVEAWFDLAVRIGAEPIH